MRWVLYIISLLWFGLGVVQILYTEKSQNILKAIMADRNPKLLSILPLLIGVLLCVSAFWSRAFWFIFSLGLLACLKATLLFFLPAKYTKNLGHWWFTKAPDQLIRLGGLILVIFSIMIIIFTINI